MKDALGGNAFSLGVFCVRNGDSEGTATALHYFRLVRKILNFPIENNSHCLGLLQRLRVEIRAFKASPGFHER